MGKTSIKWVAEAVGLYAARLSHYVPFTIEEIPDPKGSASLSEGVLKEKEADALLSRIRTQDEVVLLDEKGKEYRSVEWAALLQKKLLSNRDRLVFVVGGAYGFSPRLYERADWMLSLSKLTFSHQMVRAIFAEQLYRAFSIIKGEPYHHE